MTNFQPSYKLCLLVQRAEKLLKPEKSTTLNPYIVFQLQGSNQAVRTNVLKNTVQPIFNSELIIDGYFVGSDLLNVYVKNRGSDIESNDEVVGFEKFYISKLLLGEVQNITIDLNKYDKNKKAADKKFLKGSAGKIFVQIHVAQPKDIPFINKEWKYPLYNAWLEITDAKDCPPVSDGSANPFVTTSVSPAANIQQFKTKSVNSLTPVWKARTQILLDNFQTQTINISMASKNKKEIIPMGDYQLSLSKCNVGHIYEDNVKLSSVSGHPPAILHYKLQITAKDTDPFKFIKDKVPHEEEESIASKQSVKSFETKESSNTIERSVEILTQNEPKKHARLSGSPKRRLLNNSEVHLEEIKIKKGISDYPCVLHINLVEARNLEKECDPFVVFTIRSIIKDSTVKSKVIHNTRNPKWNENFDLNSPSLMTDTLVIDMYDKDPLPDNRLMNTIEIPVCNLPYQASFIFDRGIQLNNQTTGIINFNILPEIDNEHCHFQWGDLGSSYSSSFTGYSNKGHSISEHSSDEQNVYHVHPEVLQEMSKPKKKENITVAVTEFNNIPIKSENIQTCLTIQRRNKIKAKGDVKKFDNIFNIQQDIIATFENVKQGNLIEVLIYEISNNNYQNPVLICGRRIKVKDIIFDSQQRNYKLESPQELNEDEDNVSNTVKSSYMGELKMSFTHELNFK